MFPQQNLIGLDGGGRRTTSAKHSLCLSPPDAFVKSDDTLISFEDDVEGSGKQGKTIYIHISTHYTGIGRKFPFIINKSTNKCFDEFFFFLGFCLHSFFLHTYR
jgi:hypothetical protein